MCIGVAVQVLSCDQWQAVCLDGQGNHRLVDTHLLDQVACGDWLLVQATSAIRQLTAQEAATHQAVLTTLEQVLCGEPYDLQQGFADLLHHEVTLPEHLRHD